MAEGDPVDSQRDKRWPGRTGTGVQVQFKPWEEDSDFSDEEGIFPPLEGYGPAAVEPASNETKQ